MSLNFSLVDVFGCGPFTGNALAVVDGRDLTTEEMMAVCRWLNFSETAFLLAPSDPDADYRVRIFCPHRELPFAGHPTLGACHAWLGLGGTPRQAGTVIQQCNAGLVTVRCDGDRLAFAAPPIVRSGAVEPHDLAEFCQVLRLAPESVIDAEWADNGPGWVVLRLASAEAVLAINPIGHHERQVDIGVVGPHPAGHETAFELRAFFSDHNGDLHEDPVTGSLNAGVAQWLLREALATAPYVAAQGTRLGRSGRVFIDRDSDGVVWVGGRSRTLFEGECRFG